MRFYNPDICEKNFMLTIAEKETKVVMPKSAVVSVVFDGEHFTVDDKNILF